MLNRRTLLALVVAALPLLSAHLPSDGKGDFATALEQVQKHMDGQRWKEAKALLGSTLAAHADQPYVRERLDDVRAMTSRCAFELAVPNRGVKGVFCGTVVSYDAKRADIELRWERPKPKKDETAQPFPCADFESTAIGTVLRAPFDGPHSIELTGRALGQKTPRLFGAVDGDRYYEASLDAGSNDSIARVDKGARVLLAETSNVFNVARPYVVKLSVRPDQIEATYNGARHAIAGKLKDEFGRVGFADVLDPQTIVVQGKVRTAWIDEEIATLRKKEREEFDKTYDVNAALPAWLRGG